MCLLPDSAGYIWNLPSRLSPVYNSCVSDINKNMLQTSSQNARVNKSRMEGRKWRELLSHIRSEGTSSWFHSTSLCGFMALLLVLATK